MMLINRLESLSHRSSRQRNCASWNNSFKNFSCSVACVFRFEINSDLFSRRVLYYLTAPAKRLVFAVLFHKNIFQETLIHYIVLFIILDGYAIVEKFDITVFKPFDEFARYSLADFP